MALEGGFSAAVSATSQWSALWTFVVGVLVAVILFELWLRNTREYKMCEKIPGPPRIPVLGNAHIAIRLTSNEIMQAAINLQKKYGGTGRLWVGPLVTVIITDPADVELVLSSQHHLEKSVEYGYFKPWFGDGLLISKGHHWQHHRKMIAPTFHQSILKSFIPTFVQHSQKVVERMSKEIGKEFDVHDYMSQTTVEILLATAMGVKKLPDGNKCLEYAQAVLDMCDIIHKRQLKFYYRLDATFNLTSLSKKSRRLMDTILGMTRKVVNERGLNFNVDSRAIDEDDESEVVRQQKQAKKQGLRDDLDDIDENDVGAKKRLALLDAMMAMSQNPGIEWTDKDVLDEVNTIMFEGHDTTSAGSSFALCLLGIHKDIQAKVLSEQEAIFGDHFLRDCTFADTLEMRYLERVIMETLRLYPPVPIITRKAGQDIKLESGPYIIPKGATVMVAQYAVHRNAKDYPNPEVFDPDNFLPERHAKRHYYSFIPFSAGPRSCVGRKYAMLKLKVLLSTILRNYKVDFKGTESDLKLQADIILKVENGFNIILEPRLIERL